MKKLSILSIVFLVLVSCNDDNVISDPQDIACDNGPFIGDVRLQNQVQVDSFGALCYSSVVGNLFIGEQLDIFTDITDLNALSGLTEVYGNFQILNNNLLEDLEGLNNLAKVTGRFEIDYSIFNGSSTEGYGVLQSLEALSNLTEVHNLTIQHHNQLQSLDGLENLSSVDRIFIGHNEALNSISSLNFENTELLSLDIRDNPNLMTLDGLNHVTKIEETFFFINMSSEDIVGLNNLTEAGFIGISANFHLKTLSGLSSLERLGNYQDFHSHITWNRELINLNGLENLTEVYDLQIGSAIPQVDGSVNLDHDALFDFCGIQNLINNGTYNSIVLNENEFQITLQDIIDGNCSQ